MGKIPSGLKITYNLKPVFIGCGEGGSKLINYCSGYMYIRDKFLDGFLVKSEVVTQRGIGGLRELSGMTSLKWVS